MGEKPSDQDRRSVEEAPTVASDAGKSVEESPTLAADSRPSVEEAPTLAADSRPSVEEAPTLASHSKESVEQAATIASGAGQRGLAPLPRVARGDTFDQFVVLDEIGRGGMGVVVAAHDPDLDRKVAIKILRPGPGGTENAESASARLRREAQAMAKLAHPNVITVHQVGTRGAEIYVVMEYVGGGTLRQWAQTQERTWREVLAAYIDAGRGLAAAHRAGLVHRDFKPDNVLIDEDGRVRVTDFGLVGRIGEEGSPPEDTLKDLSSQASPSDIRKALTRPGEIMGTPYYMAPEQHKGVATDARTDQFAFCVSLYEALYDQRPFAGDTYQEVAFNAIFEPPAEPPADSAVPSRIHGLLLRGMSKRPDDRYPDMQALLAELSVDPMAARRRRLAIAAAAAALVIGAGSLYALWPETEGAHARCAKAARIVDKAWNAERRTALVDAFARSELPGADVVAAKLVENLDGYAASLAAERKKACEATYVRGEQSEELLDKRMYCLDRLQAQVSAMVSRLERDVTSGPGGTGVDTAAVLASPVRCADVEALAETIPLPTDPEAVARLEAWLAEDGELNALFLLGDYEQGLAMARRRAEEAETIGYAPAVAAAQHTLGQYLYMNGDLDAAESALRASVKAAADAKDYYAEAESWMSLIYVVGHLQGRTDEGLGLAEAARAALARIEPESVLHASLLNAEGLVLLSAGRHAEAAERLGKAVERFVEVHGPDHLDVAVARNNLANALHNLDRYEEARQHLEQVLAVRSKYLGPDHPDVATALTDLGWVAYGEGKLDEAQTHFERALEIRLAALGELNSRTADALHNLATNLDAQGKPAEALAAFQRALAILEKLHGANSMEITPTLANMGDVLLAMGEQKPAWEAYARALAIVEYVRGPEHIQVTPHVENLAFMLRQMGGYDQALQFYARSLAIREKTLGPTNFRVAETLNNRAALLMDMERYDDARADFERARYIYAHYHGEGHPDVALIDFNLGVVDEQQEQYERANERYGQALSALEARFGKDSPKLANALRGLGDVAKARADYSGADAHYDRIVRIQEQALGKDATALADPLTWQGTNLLTARDWARAVPVLARAFELRKQSGDDPALVALNQFFLAQATWGGGERTKARQLAVDARRAFAAVGDRAKGNVEEVDAWLRQHR